MEMKHFKKIGVLIYFAGTVIYLASWLAQIYLPESLWSGIEYGFMVSAYATINWFAGIGLAGKETF